MANLPREVSRIITDCYECAKLSCPKELLECASKFSADNVLCYPQLRTWFLQRCYNELCINGYTLREDQILRKLLTLRKTGKKIKVGNKNK